MRLALAQIDTTVGDLDGNRERILWAHREGEGRGRRHRPLPRARDHRLSAGGSAPAPELHPRRRARARQVAREARGIVAFVGTPHLDRDLYNACAVCAGGEVKAIYRKRFLPNYGVFDEHRYFAPGRDLFLLEHGEVLIGPTVCEDIWQPGPPATDLALAGALADRQHLGVAVPHRQGARARADAQTRARDNVCFVAFVNAVGAQDELVFDGHSVVLDDEGEVLAARRGSRRRCSSSTSSRRKPSVGGCETSGAGRSRASARRCRTFRSSTSARRTRRAASRCGDGRADARRPRADAARARARAPRLRREERLPATSWSASREDRLGADGAIACEALGPERVHCVSMPSRFSSEGTRERRARLAESLGTRLPRAADRADRRELPRDAAPVFEGREPDITEENLQARARGVMLMALSNKFGWLVVATGNKSELSVGYATLYGDMAGGFALLKDVYKTDVFRLART